MTDWMKELTLADKMMFKTCLYFICVKTGTLLDLQLVNLDLVKFKDHLKTLVIKEKEVS